MSFQDFLCDTVDIYPMQRNTSNRTTLDQAANAREPELKSVPCRIHGDKAIFPPDVILSPGDVIEDSADRERYEVVNKKRVRSAVSAHHRTYTIKRRSLYGEPTRNPT